MNMVADCRRVIDAVWIPALSLLTVLGILIAIRLAWSFLVGAKIAGPVGLVWAMIKAPVTAVIFLFGGPLRRALLVTTVAVVLLTSLLVAPVTNSPVLAADDRCVPSRMVIQVQWRYENPPPKYQQPRANTAKDKDKVNISQPVVAQSGGVTKAEALKALAYVVSETPKQYRKTAQFKKAEDKARDWIRRPWTPRSLPQGNMPFKWPTDELIGARIDVDNKYGPYNLTS